MLELCAEFVSLRHQAVVADINLMQNPSIVLVITKNFVFRSAQQIPHGGSEDNFS